MRAQNPRHPRMLAPYAETHGASSSEASAEPAQLLPGQVVCTWCDAHVVPDEEGSCPECDFILDHR